MVDNCRTAQPLIMYSAPRRTILRRQASLPKFDHCGSVLSASSVKGILGVDRKATFRDGSW